MNKFPLNISIFSLPISTVLSEDPFPQFQLIIKSTVDENDPLKRKYFRGQIFIENVFRRVCSFSRIERRISRGLS